MFMTVIAIIIVLVFNYYKLYLLLPYLVIFMHRVIVLFTHLHFVCYHVASVPGLPEQPYCIIFIYHYIIFL